MGARGFAMWKELKRVKERGILFLFFFCLGKIHVTLKEDMQKVCRIWKTNPILQAKTLIDNERNFKSFRRKKCI